MIHYIIPTIGHDISRTESSINQLADHDRKLFIDNSNSTIFEKYNNGLNSLTIKDEDVVVFVHDDITIRDETFEKKLELYFKYKDDVGLAGVIGTNLFVEQGGWWLSDRQQHSRGRIIQGSPDVGEYTMAEPMGMDDSDIVSIDGCIMFMRGTIANEYRFDTNTYNGYHFYDVDTSFSILEMGWNIGIIDVLVKHESEGPLSESWHKSKEKFLNKWRNKGFEFPITKSKFSKNE